MKVHCNRLVPEDYYGVPFPPEFNVPFYIVLCTIYRAFCVCHLSLNSRFNFFAFNIQLRFMQHSSFRFRHSTFHKQQSSFLIRSSSSVECTISVCPGFKFSLPTSEFGHCTCKFPHSTFNFSNSTLTRWSATDGDRGLN